MARVKGGVIRLGRARLRVASRVAVEEAAECVEFGDAPFADGGQAGLEDSEVGGSLKGTPAAS